MKKLQKWRKAVFLPLLFAYGCALAAPSAPYTVKISTPVTVGFTPAVKGQDSALSVVQSAIKSAKTSIYVAAYSFTSKPIVTALVAAHKRGIDVRLVADAKASHGHYSAVNFAANHGIPTRVDGHYAIMHNKFLVIDGVGVETGSFNYTKSAATRNAENVVWFHDAPAIVKDYTYKWGQLWEESKPVEKSY